MTLARPCLDLLVALFVAKAFDSTALAADAPLGKLPPGRYPGGLDCLQWPPLGCSAIRSAAACIQSREGRATAWSGARVYGDPCVWCGGVACRSGSLSLCEPLTVLINKDGRLVPPAAAVALGAAVDKGEHLPDDEQGQVLIAGCKGGDLSPMSMVADPSMPAMPLEAAMSSAASAQGGGAQGIGDQCGGFNWTGPTHCAAGLRCQFDGHWSSKCVGKSKQTQQIASQAGIPAGPAASEWTTKPPLQTTLTTTVAATTTAMVRSRRADTPPPQTTLATRVAATTTAKVITTITTTVAVGLFHNVEIVQPTSTTIPATSQASRLSPGRWASASQDAGGQTEGFAFRRASMAEIHFPSTSGSKEPSANGLSRTWICIFLLTGLAVVLSAVALLHHRHSNGAQCKWAGVAAEWAIPACEEGGRRMVRSMALVSNRCEESEQDTQEGEEHDDVGSLLEQSPTSSESPALSQEFAAPSPYGRTGASVDVLGNTLRQCSTQAVPLNGSSRVLSFVSPVPAFSMQLPSPARLMTPQASSATFSPRTPIQSFGPSSGPVDSRATQPPGEPGFMPYQGPGGSAAPQTAQFIPAVTSRPTSPQRTMHDCMQVMAGEPPPSFGRGNASSWSLPLERVHGNFAQPSSALGVETGEVTPVGSDVIHVDLQNLRPAEMMYQLSPVPGASMQPLGLTPLPMVE